MTLGTMMIPAMGGEITPKTIYPGQLPWWVNLDNKIVTGQGVSSLTDLAKGTDPLLQSVDGDRPPVIQIAGKDYSDHANTSEFLRAESVSPVYIPSGTDKFSLWAIARFDSASSTKHMIQFSNGADGSSGIAFGVAATDDLKMRVFTASPVAQTVALPDNGVHIWHFNYDGAFITLEINGIPTGTPRTLTGGLAHNCDRVTIGRNAAGSSPFDGAFREGALVLAARDAAKEAAMLTYLQGQL